MHIGVRYGALLLIDGPEDVAATIRNRSASRPQESFSKEFAFGSQPPNCISQASPLVAIATPLDADLLMNTKVAEAQTVGDHFLLILMISPSAGINGLGLHLFLCNDELQLMNCN